MVASQLTHLDTAVVDKAAEYGRQFAEAEPFRHVAIDGFFEPDFAESLLGDFPAFNPQVAISESGAVGGKAVNTKIREIGPSYDDLDRIIRSQPFLDFITEVSGIPDLLLDSRMHGGGTHENLHGQDLDPHVDFNYDEARQLHRRLNLIVYLNHDWKEEWGGALEIHSNPRRPDQNQITVINPLFNRAVLFETNEYSWHGFPKINLPPEERHRSRKSISIYLYTKTRPAEEIAPDHATFYVQRPLPERFQAGYVLTEEDKTDLLIQLTRRDRWIELYQNLELRKNEEIATYARYIAELQSLARPPLLGYVLQQGLAVGFYPEGWTRGQAELTLNPRKPVKSVTVKGWRPETAPQTEISLAISSLTINGSATASSTVAGGVFELKTAFPTPLTEPFKLAIRSGTEFRNPGDERDVSFIVMEIGFGH